MQKELNKVSVQKINKDPIKRLERELRVRKFEELPASEKLRQVVCQSSHELRELKQHLDCLYMNAVRCDQIKEKKQSLKQEKEKEREYTKNLQQKVNLEQKKQILCEEKAKERMLNYKSILERQLSEREEAKIRELELFAREKEAVDAAICKIQLENVLEQEKKHKQRQVAQEYIAEFKKQRQEYKKMLNEKEKMEDLRIKKYSETQDSRKHDLDSQKLLLLESKNEAYHKLALKMEIEERKKREFEQLRTDLAEQELDEEMRIQEQISLEKRLKSRMELIDAYHAQMMEKQEARLLKFKQDEEDRVNAIMELEAETKKQIYTRERAKMMKQNYQTSLSNFLELKKIRQREFESLVLAEERKLRELEEFRDKIINEEKQKMLEKFKKNFIVD